MKRSAENQLTKDSSVDDSEETEAIGFQPASSEALSERKIRGMPKRKIAGVSTPSTSTDTAPKPSLFGAFAGFGATPSMSTSSTTDSVPKPVAPLFGGLSGSSTGFGAPPTAAPAANLAFTFTTPKSGPPPAGSLFAGQSNIFAPSSSSIQPTTGSGTKPFATSSADAGVKYYLSLRGLNHSVLTTLESLIAKDPFAELPLELIAKAYASYRKEIGDKPPAAKFTISGPPKVTPPVFNLPSNFSFNTGFKAHDPPSSTAAPSTSLFGAKPADPKPTEAPKVPSFFGSTGEIKPSTSLFSFSKPAEVAKVTIDQEKPKESSTATASSLYPFSALSDNTSSSTTTPSAAPLAVPKTANYFSFSATPSATPTATPATPQPAEKRPPLFGGFGSGSKSSSFGFGAATPGLTPPIGSLGNPVGFVFGSPKKDAVAEGTITPTPGTTVGLQAAAALADASTAPASSAASVLGSELPSREETPADVVPSNEEKMGEGEQDEETVFWTLGKLNRYKSKAWEVVGRGQFKIKKHKETGVRRVLMRSENGGKVLANFRLHPEMDIKPGAKPTMFLFTGHEEGAPMRYQVQVKTAQLAEEIKKIFGEVG